MGIEFLVEVFLTGPGLGNMALLVVLLLARQAKKKRKKIALLDSLVGNQVIDDINLVLLYQGYIIQC